MPPKVPASPACTNLKRKLGQGGSDDEVEVVRTIFGEENVSKSLRKKLIGELQDRVAQEAQTSRPITHGEINQMMSDMMQNECKQDGIIGKRFQGVINRFRKFKDDFECVSENLKSVCEEIEDMEKRMTNLSKIVQKGAGSGLIRKKPRLSLTSNTAALTTQSSTDEDKKTCKLCSEGICIDHELK